MSASTPTTFVLPWCSVLCWNRHSHELAPRASDVYASSRFSHRWLENESWLASCMMHVPNRDEADDEHPGGGKTDHGGTTRGRAPVAGGDQAADQQRLAVQSPARRRTSTGEGNAARHNAAATEPEAGRTPVPVSASWGSLGVEREPRSDKLTTSSARFTWSVTEGQSDEDPEHALHDATETAAKVSFSVCPVRATRQ